MPAPVSIRPLLAVLSASFLGVTVLLGVLLRFELAFGVAGHFNLSFLNLRHAHSHAGFYGFLTLAWAALAWRERLVRRLWEALAYAGAVSLAIAGFSALGYRWPTIALSTLIAAFWVTFAVRQSRDIARENPRSVMLWGVATASLFLVPIAVTARRDFALSRMLAHLFIGGLLFTVFLPLALSALGGCLKVNRLAFWGLGWLASAGATLSSAHTIAALGVVPWVMLWGLQLRRDSHLRPWARALWGLIPALLTSWLLLPPLHTETARVAGIHFLLLGPVAVSLFLAWTGRVPGWGVLAYLLYLGGVTAQLAFAWPVLGFAAAEVSAMLAVPLVLAVLLGITLMLRRYHDTPATDAS